MQNGSDQRFATTIWSDILKLRDDSTSTQAVEAVNALCSRYWYPIYACVRRQGYSPQDSEDLTQGFFAHLLADGFFSKVDPAQGTFRAYAQGWLKNWVSKQYARGAAKKRGGGQRFVSIDQEIGEGRYKSEPADSQDPWKLLVRKWAQATLERARERLREELDAAGNGEMFMQLAPALFQEEYEGNYADVAWGLKISASAVKSRVSRLRQRFYELVRQEIAQTVPDRGDIDDELRALIAALAE